MGKKKKFVQIQYSFITLPIKKTLRVWITEKGKRIELDPNQFTVKGNTLILKK